MARIISMNHLRAEREAAGVEVAEAELHQSIGEMITTPDGLMDLVEKVQVDVEFGQAETPLLYEPIYRRIAPAGGFPGKTVDIGENTIQANVVFFEKFEGGEVQFGVLEKGAPATARLRTWAAGFAWTEDMEEWDSTWEFEMVNQAFGRSYNFLLNHLHLYPIISYTYVAANQTPADVTAGASLAERTRRTFAAAYKSGVTAVPQRTPRIILASEADRFQIEEALLQSVLDAAGNPIANVPVDTIIYYDGADVEMGTELYNYPGVTPGKCYFIYPKQRMLELVHHGLRVTAGDADVTRLIEAKIVGRTRRGLYAEIPSSVEEITLPV